MKEVVGGGRELPVREFRRENLKLTGFPECALSITTTENGISNLAYLMWPTSNTG